MVLCLPCPRCAPDFDAYCKAKGLKFTLKKVDGVRVYELSKDSLKKRLLKSLTAEECEGPEGKTWKVRAAAGGKFSAEEFLRQAFLLPEPGDWVRDSALGRLRIVEATPIHPALRIPIGIEIGMAPGSLLLFQLFEVAYDPRQFYRFLSLGRHRQNGEGGKHPKGEYSVHPVSRS